MRCDNCGSTGVRNQVYCNCAYGRIRMARERPEELDRLASPEFREAQKIAMEKYRETFRRLADS